MSGSIFVNTLFILRTNSDDAVFQHLSGILSRHAPGKVVVVCDERLGPVNTGGLEKISINEAALERIGISNLPSNWGWLCGDMCYYLAASAFPNFDYYFLIESDVFIPEASAVDFFERLSHSDQSALAVNLRNSDHEKKYSRALSALNIDPQWGCIFPMTRVSSAVLAKMRELREEEARILPHRALNDEAVLAGAVAATGCSFGALEELFPETFSTEDGRFFTSTRWLFETLLFGSNDRRIYHSALCLDTILDGIRSGHPKFRYRRMRHIRKFASGEVREKMRLAYLDAEATG